MAKNVIIMVGDGMGWEMSRAAAIQAQIEQEIADIRVSNPNLTNEEIAAQFAGRTLSDYYTEGVGQGTSYQQLSEYAIATTGNTYIDGSKGNSALQGTPFNHNTGESKLRDGFVFNPDAAVVEGFDPNLRDQAFDEDPVFDGVKAPLDLGNFTIGFDEARVSETASGFFVMDTLGLGIPLFDLSNPDVVTVDDGTLRIDSADLLVSTELASALGDDGLIGVDVGDARIDAVLSGDANTFTVESGVTSVALDTALLEDAANLTLTGADSGATPSTDDFQVGFEITDSTDFTFTTENGFTPVSGDIDHSGSVTFDLFVPGNAQGGNVPIFDLVAGGVSPWDPNYYENRDNPTQGFDKDYILNLYPDSAGTATALYTGTKTYVGAIGVDIFENSVETLAEQALGQGKATGVVSSVPFNHATPAAAIAHVNNRNKTTELSFDSRAGNDNGDPTDDVDEFGHEIHDSDNIFHQIVNETQPTVVLGGGHPDGRGDERYLTYAELENLRNGVYDYTFLERAPGAAEILADTASGLDPDDGDRLFGVYGARGQGGNLPWRSANDDYSRVGIDYSVSDSTFETRELAPGETDEQFIARETDENPTLTELTTAALDVLEEDDQGFWLMIEGGDIDWAAHANDMDAMLGTLKDFDESVAATQEWIADNGGWEENLLIVTADHDHYLTLNDDFPELLAAELLLGDGGLGLTAEQDAFAAGHFWGSDETVKQGWQTHTTKPVPVYFQGAGSENLLALQGEAYDAYGTTVQGVGTYIDQVHIGLAMSEALLAEDVDTIEGDDGNNDLTGGRESDAINGGLGDDDISGGRGDDTLMGGEGDDNLSGNRGFDLISGDQGDDDLYGGRDDDTLMGGEGDDILVGGKGNDLLTGDANSDLFVLAAGDGTDTVTDFNLDADFIGLSGDLSFEALVIEQGVGDQLTDTLVTVADTNELLAILNGVQADSLTSSLFESVAI